LPVILYLYLLFEAARGVSAGYSCCQLVVSGIGALLLDGLGDTIRVSLTEDPELEIEPCTRLANLGMNAAEKVFFY
jgi:4-hydroxy-3-methylbut-2-en-1-yl diphosphate synthase IspG/GcpE